ncbi:MAG: NlpC/P60 family protein [Bacteroidales bacterium]
MNAICPLSQVPVRFEPSEKSEMVTQLLFGETFTITEEKGNWLLITSHLDNYTGWIDRKQALKVPKDFIEQYIHRTRHFMAAKTGICTCLTDSTHILLTKGSILPLFHKGDFALGNKVYHTKEKCKVVPRQFKPSKVFTTAMEYLNVPYLWGGRSILGVDCSGFVQVVYQMCGIDLPRDASQQVEKGFIVDFVDEAQPGDLAFFDNLMGEIIHVGIMIGDGNIIHASGQVRIDKIDHNGIFNGSLGTYTHSLRIIKRL